MFLLTSDIQIVLSNGQTVRVKPQSVKWVTSVKAACDNCIITLPLHPYVYSKKQETDVMTKEKECRFAVGNKVSVSLGYDGRNTSRFTGFVAAVNYNTTLELKCEGYYWLLKKEEYTNMHWPQITLKMFLQELIKGTDIQLSKYIPEVNLGDVSLDNITIDKIFEFLESDYGCISYFTGNTLYSGASYFPEAKATKKLRIGYNVKSGTLTNQPLSEKVEIRMVVTDSKGKTTKSASTGKYRRLLRNSHRRQL